MLELIFQGFLEWFYGLVLECWEYFSSALLDVMSMDFSYLETHMPVLPIIRQSMLAVGWALLIGNLVFQAIRSMASGLGFEGEDPKLLFTRTFVFSFLLLASPQICDICLNMTSIIIGIMEMPDAVDITFLGPDIFGALTAAWLLVILCGVIVMFQSFKLIVEMAERYFILAMLTITAPLAFGMGGSKNTSDIFSGWCRMYGSMCLLMVLNVVFVKMLLSVLSFVPTGLDVLPWMVLVLTVVKVAKKADAIVTRIGLNPAITGDSLGRTFPGALTYMVVRSAASQVTKSIGKAAGNHGGQNPKTPPNGGNPKSGGPTSGGPRSGSTTTSRTTQQSTSQQTAQSNATQQTTQQTSATQSTNTQSAGTNSNPQNERNTILGSMGNPSRKTSVPPGTRRSSMHTNTARAVANNTNSDTSQNTVRSGTAGMRSGIAGQRPQQPQGVQNGTAGTENHSSATRFSNVTNHAGGQSAVNVKEQSNVTANSSSKAVSPSGADVQNSTSSSPKETRFTQRPDTTSREHLRTGVSNSKSQVQNSASQSGNAGMAASASHTASGTNGETRYSRNTATTNSPVGGKAQTIRLAPQETRQSTRPQQSASPATAPSMHHGNAGTATGNQQTMRMSHTSVKQTQQAPISKAVLNAKVTGGTGPKEKASRNTTRKKAGNGKQ